MELVDMQAENVKELLNKIENLHWQVSPARRAEEVVEWVPVADLFRKKSFTVGITRAGSWMLQRCDYLIVLVPGNFLRDLLPCLERPIKEIKALLCKGLETRGIPVEIYKSFPFSGIVYSGFFIKLDYWADLAFNWLDDVALTGQIVDALTNMVHAKWASQKNRHKAQYYLSRLSEEFGRDREIQSITDSEGEPYNSAQ